MEEVRQADDHDVGVGVVDGRRQVGGRLGDAPALAERIAALGTARIDDPDAVAAALAVERVGVEVADQAGAEHRDRVAVHRSSSLSVRAEDEVAAGDEGTQLGAGRPAGGLAEAAVGDEREPLGRDAGRQHGIDPLGDVVGRLDVRVLDIDDAGGDVATGGGDLAEDRDLGHLAVGELEHELVDTEAEHRVEDRPICPARKWPAEVVAEAEMGAEPHLADDRLDRRVEQRREVGRGIRMDGRRWFVDLDERRAGRGQARELRPQDRHERLRRGVALRVDLARAVGQAAGQRVRPGKRHLERTSRCGREA